MAHTEDPLGALKMQAGQQPEPRKHTAENRAPLATHLRSPRTCLEFHTQWRQLLADPVAHKCELRVILGALQQVQALVEIGLEVARWSSRSSSGNCLARDEPTASDVESFRSACQKRRAWGSRQQQLIGAGISLLKGLEQHSPRSPLPAILQLLLFWMSWLLLLLLLPGNGSPACKHHLDQRLLICLLLLLLQRIKGRTVLLCCSSVA